MIRRPPRSTLFPSTTLFRSEARVLHVLVLLHAWQVRPLAARDGERAVREDALAVYHVADELLDGPLARLVRVARADRKSTRLNSSHANISYAVFCLKKKTAH